MKKIIFIMILIMAGMASAHTVTLNFRFNISGSDVVHVNGTSYNASQSINATWYAPEKKYIISEDGTYAAGIANSEDTFESISLEKTANEYSLKLSQGNENRFLLFFAKSSWQYIDENILSIGKIMRKTFGPAMALSSPGYIFLTLRMGGIDIINDENWGSGSHELLFKNTGRGKIKIDLVR